LAAESKAPVKIAQKQDVVTSDCYTVVLFTKAKVAKPDPAVPAEYNAFLGEWGAGAWNDVWCHDLMVTNVYADGRADVFEMHAPYAPWGQPATAYRRAARFDDKGRLRFAYGTETISYELVNGRLEATRAGKHGNLKATLVRRGMPPIPSPRPTQLVQASATAVPGT
jgi:hypothetical protein